MQEPSANAYDLDLNSSVSTSLELVGNEKEPVVTVDKLLRKPAALVDFAAKEVDFTPAWTAHGGYPGLRAPAPLNYANKLVRALSPIIERAYSLKNMKPVQANCYLSLVTLKPGQLAPLQSIPHIDIADPLRFAFLHFLCDEHFGGTAFYRHRATGFETINAQQEPVYLEARDRELAAKGPVTDYIDGDTDHYEQTSTVDARWNRVLIYRSQLLHSGQIPPGFNFSADPREGRLTANVFVTYRPA
jgi:hypothetical protein